jgi:hypothetical protein
MTDKRPVFPRDGNLRYVEPTHYVVSKKMAKKTSKSNSSPLKAITSHEDIDAKLKTKLEKVFAKAVKSPLASQKLLISKGYKLESLAGEKVVKLSSVLNTKGQIKKWGDLSVLYVHNFLAEGFDVILGQHPKYPEDADKAAIYLKK